MVFCLRSKRLFKIHPWKHTSSHQVITRHNAVRRLFTARSSSICSSLNKLIVLMCEHWFLESSAPLLKQLPHSPTAHRQDSQPRLHLDSCCFSCCFSLHKPISRVKFVCESNSKLLWCIPFFIIHSFIHCHEGLMELAYVSSLYGL